VQRVRDEAHRYAITSHRQRRDKAGVASQLDAIPGIGPLRRKALLAHFGGIQEIRQATPEELLTIPGITIKLAEAIRAALG
jgi:excinuclease ABC subunit C